MRPRIPVWFFSWVAAVLALANSRSEAEIRPAGVACVYSITDPGAIAETGHVDPVRVRRMVDSLVMAIAQKTCAVDAWRTFVAESDTVGIKVAASAGPLGGTRPEVAEAVAAGLREAGLPRERIIVWDRSKKHLLACGYRMDSPFYTLRWVEGPEDFDADAVVSAPLLGRLIWGDRGFGDREGTRMEDWLAGGEQLSTKSHLARLLVRETTKVVNLPSALDSVGTGVHGALANMTLPNLDNWRRFTRGPQHGNPYIAEIYADPRVGGKVVLTILDALFVQYAGGPFPNPNATVQNRALFASRDPVALDALLLEMIEPFRVSAKLPPARGLAGHLEAAEALGLGHAQPSRIQTLRVGLF